MRVLLIRHPYRFVEGSVATETELPIGLIHLASALEQAGHTVRLYDAAVRYDLAAMDAADAAGRDVIIGDAWDRFAQAVAGEWDLVGISNMFYTQMPMALEAARVVRRVLPRTPIVIGGPPATVRPEDYLAEPAVDYVLRGEGELALVGLAGALAQGRPVEDLPSLSLRKDGAVRSNPLIEYPQDLDVLPMPAYHLLNLDEQMVAVRRGRNGWRLVPRRVVPVITSRGCPFHCNFCSIHLHMGRRWRMHSVAYVLRHVRHILTQLGHRHIDFMDDNMGLDPRRLEALLDGFLALRREGLSFTWRTPTGMRTDRLTREVLAKARQAGCTAISLAVESGSQRVLKDVVHKQLDLDQVVAAAGWCREVGIKARAGYIMSLPGETRQDMEATIRFATMLKRRYGIRGHLATATPFYGTELYETCARNGYLALAMTPDNVARGVQGRSMIRTPDFTSADMDRMRRRFNRQGSWPRYGIRQVGRAIRRAFKGRRESEDADQ
jgi:magnesium-protoporphyrin IX monomethyl ester (oxidative) cyclase